MLRTQPFRFLALVLVLAIPPVACAGDSAAKTLSKEYLTLVRAETQDLVRAVERLQEAIIEELGGRKERVLYRQTDELLTLLLDFERTLDSKKISRSQLYAAFSRVDTRLHKLVEAVAQVKNQRALSREASRILEADEELHYALSGGDSSEKRALQVLQRQTNRMLYHVRELEETAGYALLKQSGEVYPASFHKLVEAVSLFQKSVEAGAEQKQLRRDFQKVDQSWQAVVQVLKRIKPSENRYLLRSAAQVDQSHERLFRLLGLKGERSRLIIST